MRRINAADFATMTMRCPTKVERMAGEGLALILDPIPQGIKDGERVYITAERVNMFDRPFVAVDDGSEPLYFREVVEGK